MTEGRMRVVETRIHDAHDDTLSGIGPFQCLPLADAFHAGLGTGLVQHGLGSRGEVQVAHLARGSQGGEDGRGGMHGGQ